MFYKINDFIQNWKNESETTKKVFAELSDASLKQKVYENGRTLGELAWHITLTIGEMMSHTGMKIETHKEDAPVPSSAEEILSAYSKSSDAFISILEKSWNDEMLNEDIPMYGETWKKSFVLQALIVHQIHHRGQMTVLMRQAGLKVPGVYGPSREEWEAMGMPAHK